MKVKTKLGATPISATPDSTKTIAARVIASKKGAKVDLLKKQR